MRYIFLNGLSFSQLSQLRVTFNTSVIRVKYMRKLLRVHTSIANVMCLTVYLPGAYMSTYDYLLYK